MTTLPLAAEISTKIRGSASPVSSSLVVIVAIVVVALVVLGFLKFLLSRS